MKSKRVALYNPYLDTFGGGERHVLSILKVLQDEGYVVDIFWDIDLSEAIETTFDMKFRGTLNFIPGWNTLSRWERMRTTAGYDIFLYISDGSFIVSLAKHTFIFCMIPQKKLFHMNTINRLKTLNSRFISNSLFTRNLLAKWGVNSSVLYPYIDQELFDLVPQKKHIILNVGRFFESLHAKRQDVCIDWFIKFKKLNPAFTDLSLVLVGGQSPREGDYVASLRSTIAGRRDIEIKTNITYEELRVMYSQASIMWHFAGFEIDARKHPENTEHLGITPLEAMATETVPMAYAAGGPTEIIHDGVNGFLFTNQEKLFADTASLLNSDAKRQQLAQSGKAYAQNLFSYDMFVKEVKRIIISACL